MKFIVITAILLFGCLLCRVEAQNYKLNKQTYDFKMYTPQPDDPHNPTIMGITSLLVPGLGRILTGETRRGLAFMGGTFAAYGFGILGLKSSNSTTNDVDEILNQMFMSGVGGGLIIFGILTHFWSIFDAVTVAKVNNMYFQDKHSNLSSFKLELNPFVGTNNYLGQTNVSAGLSLKVTF